MDAINTDFIDPMTGDKLAGDLAEDLAAELEIAGLAAAVTGLVDDTSRELEVNRDHHASAYATYARRIENARRHQSAEIAEIEDEKRRLRQKFEADLHKLDVECKAIETAAAAEIATAKKLAAASKSALEALQP